MKKLLLMVLLVFAIASTALSQNSGSTTDITTTITNMEQKIVDAIKNADWETLESHFGDEFLGVYGWGISERNEELESLKKVEMRSYDMSDIKVVQPTENVAIIAYKLAAEGSYMDEDFTGTYFASTTWVNEDGTWKAAMHTEAKEEAMQEDSDMDTDSDYR